MLAKAATWQAPLVLTFAVGPNAALLTLPDVALFIADSDYELESAAEIHEAVGTDGSAVTLDVKKATGTQAAGSGTTMLASTFNLKATANTVVTKNRSNGGLTTTAANQRLTSGDRLVLDFGGTLTALAGVCVTVTLKRLRRPTY